MAGLIPVDGGGGESRLTCFRCGDLAAGPCAFCGVMNCASDDCARVVREPGLEPAALCAECARRRPGLAGRAWTAPLAALAGAALLAAVAASGSTGPAAGLGSIAALALVALAAAAALARWQWRSRLARARRGPRRG